MRSLLIAGYLFLVGLYVPEKLLGPLPEPLAGHFVYDLHVYVEAVANDTDELALTVKVQFLVSRDYALGV